MEFNEEYESKITFSLPCTEMSEKRGLPSIQNFNCSASKKEVTKKRSTIF